MSLHQWNGKYIASPLHEKDLEDLSAEFELGPRKLDRKAAETAAYEEYKRKHHTAAITHHAHAMRHAMSEGKKDEAEKHSALYTLHMKALGMNPNANPPPSATEQRVHEDAKQFKPHPADHLLFGSSMEKSDRDAFFKYVESSDSATYMSEPDDDPDLKKSLRSPMSLDQVDGQRVRVYFNLHNKLFSLQHKGRVIAHLPEVALEDVAFNVHPQKHDKNSHAFVEGKFKHFPTGSPEHQPQGVAYNPFKHKSFVRTHDQSPIHGAKHATLKNSPHPTITVKEEAQQHAEPSWNHGKK